MTITYKAFKNNKVAKILQEINSRVTSELYDYSSKPQPEEESNESGILEGRYEFANEIWEIIK